MRDFSDIELMLIELVNAFESANETLKGIAKSMHMDYRNVTDGVYREALLDRVRKIVNDLKGKRVTNG